MPSSCMGRWDPTVIPAPRCWARRRPRAAQPPRRALAALKSRPWSVPGEAGTKFCTQMGACASPRELGRVAPTGDGERSEQVVACSGSRRTGCPGPHLVAGGHVADFPGRRSGLGSASLTLYVGRTRRRALCLQPLGKSQDSCSKSSSAKHFHILSPYLLQASQPSRDT